jgi:phytoene dehydrogenase-like protein
MSQAATHDTIVVGGGHNGLVTAFYLARAGRRPLVLERRPIVGGACVTEEFAPGYRASTGAYVLSMLRPEVWRDMDLARRGVAVDSAGPGPTTPQRRPERSPGTPSATRPPSERSRRSSPR